MNLATIALAFSLAGCAIGMPEPLPDVRRTDIVSTDEADAGDDTSTLDAMPCGATGTPCCAGGRCAMGRVCTSGVCVVSVDCGGDGQACCMGDGGGTCTDGFVCTAGRCATPMMAMCGGPMQPCCSGGSCQAGTVCLASQCTPCGQVAQPCCAGACLAGVCVSGSCAVDADHDGVSPPTDCNDGNAAIRPGARERCNGVDDDCNGTIDDGTVCGLWTLPRGATRWNAYPIDATHDADPTMRSPHAPTPGATLRGMFSVEAANVAYAITDTSYHVLDLATRTWTAHGTRNSLVPQISGSMVTGVYAVPARAGMGGTTDTITWVTPSAVYNYSIDPTTLAVSFLSMSGPVSWAGDPNAPSTSGWHFLWLDLDNAEHWVTTDIHSICTGLPPDAVFQRYLALVDSTGGPSGTMHVTDLGYCFRWAPAQSVDAFPPFTVAGSPRTTEIGATFYRSGLWAIRPQAD